MVPRAIGNNRSIVFDHSDQRKIWIDTYQRIVLGGVRTGGAGRTSFHRLCGMPGSVPDAGLRCSEDEDHQAHHRRSHPALELAESMLDIATLRGKGKDLSRA